MGYPAVLADTARFYKQLCQLLGRDELATDERFATNPQRVRNRQQLVPMLQTLFLQRDTDDWLDELRSVGIPCGAINTISQVFHDPQIQARGLVWQSEHPTAGTIQLSRSLIRLSETPTRL